MKHSLHVALRVGVCVAMATTSVAAFAGEQDETSAKTDRDEQMQPASVSPNTDLTPTKYDEAEGAGGGEPAGAQARMQADARFKDKAAIQAYNQEKFLEQSWMAAP